VEGKFSSSKYASISQKCKRALSKPGHHLFIAPRTNMTITSSLGEFSDRPDAPVELTGRAAPRPIALCRPRVPPCSTLNVRSQRSTQRSNGQTSDRTLCSTDQTRYTGVRFESSKGPLATGRVQSIVTGRAPRLIDLAIVVPLGA
jgi:hypothetical protein